MNRIATFLPSFRNEAEYAAYREAADDRDQLHETLVAYEENVEVLMSTLKKAGVQVTRGPFQLADLITWLRDQKLANVGTTRTGYWAKLARDMRRPESLS